MSQIKTLNGVQYTLPQYNDTAWGANTGNVLTQYLAAIADVTLQLSGGSFTLTADVDFGANFGLKALFLKSETANPASAGVVRLAKTDAIKWRNNANGADIALAIDGSDNLTYATNKVFTAGGAAGIVNADIASGAAIAYSKLALTGSIVNADIGASAAIAYSKLSLTGGIVNADINASAAIAYSKLALTGGIVNADVNASAAIALTKLAALTSHSRALASDASGFIVESAVTATELGYVSGVTSAIQTQLNATIANPLTSNLAAGSHKLTGLAAGTANGDSIRYEQVNGQRILQTVFATFTTNLSTTSSTFQATATTANITPASTSSKIKITVTGVLRNRVCASTIAIATIERGTTDLSTGGAGFAAVGSSGGTAGDFYGSGNMCYLDSPATASQVTYTVYVKSTNNSSDIDWNNAGTASILLEEIG